VAKYVSIPYVEYKVILRLRDGEGGLLLEFPEIIVSDATDKWNALVKACEATICPDGRTLDKVSPMSNLWKWASIKKVKPEKEYHRRAE